MVLLVYMNSIFVMLNMFLMIGPFRHYTLCKSYLIKLKRVRAESKDLNL